MQCNGFTNYHLRKTSTKSDGVCYEGRDLLRESRKMYASCPDANLPTAKDLAQLSPLEDDSLHRLRSRRNLILPSILIGTTAEDASRQRGISSQTSNHYLRSSVSPRSCTYATRSKLPNHVNEEAATFRKVLNSPISANHVATTPHKEAKHSITSDTHFTRSKLNIVLPMVDAFDRKMSHEPSLASPGRPAKRKASAVSDDEDLQNGAASPTGGFPITKKFKIALCNNVSPHQTDAAAERSNYNRKRMSAEEKFLEDNKAYYKVEMLRTKLRSTESYCSQVLYAPGRDESKEADAADGAAKSNDEPRAHKLPKRNSALHLLNLEAEKFMFGSPKRDKSDDEDGEDEERQGRAASGGSKGKEIVENGVDDEDDEQKAYAKQNGRRTGGKKRRTHAELFIHDNLDYYKFEISGSRLRHQGDNSGSASVKSETNSCSSFEAAKIKEEAMTDDDEAAVRGTRSRKKQEMNGDALHRVSSYIASNLGNEPSDTASSADASCCGPSLPPPEAICFSFESVPSKEPWYRAFQRYDSCDEQCLHIPRTVYFSRYRDTHPPPTARKDRQSVAFAGVKEASPSTNAGSSSSGSSLLAQHFRRKGRQKIIAGRIVIDDKPRKSPRCHASTLAILSSLTSHRRRSRKLLEAKKASVASAPKTKKVVSAEQPKAAAAELSVEQQQQLRETFSALAKEADEHFINVFSRDDCEDRYLRGLSGGSSRATKQPEATHDWRKCLLVDESILQDDETLKWFAEGSLFDGGAMMDDMGSFMENAQRCCTSMESAAEEEWSGAARQHHDTLSRLCRENDFSCNSSDCGASSTCEFLGFSEDGRSVSRKRKRKRPNMTGWPKRRHMRFLERRRANVRSGGENVAGSQELQAGDEGVASEPAASTRVKATPSSSAAATSEAAPNEADSECSEDDVPLVNILNRKKRRTNSTATSEDKEERSSVASSPRATPRKGRRFPLSRRKCKNSSPSKTSLPRAATRGLAASPRRRGRKLPLSRRRR